MTKRRKFTAEFKAKVALDALARFAKSQTVGAYFGLTPKRYQSGETDYSGRIRKVGHRAVRSALYEAATVLLRRSTKPSALKSWGSRIAHQRGHKKAVVAIARKLAIILHRIWVNNETEPPRVSRRRFGLSHATMANSLACA
ncbi:MAG: hypothetical protein CMM61_05865 [Rhodospirillaceae bacterium]|nr:hypothetical protein [Rhodospirillaceae bacterium]|tara:strand:+ start:494 stop:919 length:426 start_codon:yes stop_codon:yes gene_type:complete